jgi:hypothetical protein
MNNILTPGRRDTKNITDGRLLVIFETKGLLIASRRVQPVLHLLLQGLLEAPGLASFRC